MASKFNYKSPPEMRDGLSYSDWKKELAIWCAFTDLEKKRQGGALFLTLAGKARETVLAEVALVKINADSGVDAITHALDKLFEKDKAESAFASFENFIKFRRPSDMSIKDYMIEFNLRLNRIKDHNMDLPEGVLAYYLLNCGNLTEDQTSLCRATCTNLTYAEMKTQIERVSIKPTSDNATSKSTSQIEPQFVAQFHQDEQYVYDDPDAYEYEEEEASEDTFYMHPGNKPMSSFPRGRYDIPARKKNPPDEFGNPTPCRFCKSIFHWIDRCPDMLPGSRQSSSTARGRGRGAGYPSRGRGRGAGATYSGRGGPGGRGTQFQF